MATELHEYRVAVYFKIASDLPKSVPVLEVRKMEVFFFLHKIARTKANLLQEVQFEWLSAGLQSPPTLFYSAAAVLPAEIGLFPAADITQPKAEADDFTRFFESTDELSSISEMSAAYRRAERLGKTT
ncbi:hypothetical protein EVAR_101418_1 [Eumeta japonica]|uniref:Uncharacterized protein n=1 Tax=Eumeta variegata TaxID=151549 RepID=A0A4C1SGY5_EUMVA|nr:hypothetical protein EVAR_101418_1 [Eumeta japonica]